MQKKLPENAERFLRSCKEKLDLSQLIRQNPGSYMNLASNSLIFADSAQLYDQSFANPACLHAMGFERAGLLSVLYQFFNDSLRDVILGRPLMVWDKSDLLVAIRAFFHEGDDARLQAVFDQYGIRTQILAEETRMRESVNPRNPFATVLAMANPRHLDWMSGYGLPVSAAEQEYCRFLFSLPEKMLERLAHHIADAFMHGFLSQSRDIAGRNLVRLSYALGQEALAGAVIEALRERGMQSVVLPPSCTGYSRQHLADHRFDQAAYADEECYIGQARAYQSAAEQYRAQLLNICGFIRIGSFGAKTTQITPSVHAFQPSPEALALYRGQMTRRRSAEAALLKPDTLSFCSVVFPDPRIGARFAEIFDDFVKLNTEDSRPYEQIQSKLIDLLDHCRSVRIKGKNGNRTDLRVRLHRLADPLSQTNFLNCGGDLNIPHGEIFTTPRLSGSDGLLHVREAYLQEHYYRDLSLEFRDGRVVDYGCGNTGDAEADRRYVYENLLRSTEGVPMGELAIGTNTQAYQTAKKHDIYNCLPILIAEKMGPHIAVGDPCFARGEDTPVFNLDNGKEMTARENELTAMRPHTEACYMNFHTDITIPYDEIAVFEGLREKGGGTVIIEDGLFRPIAAAALNEPLRKDI